MAANAFILDDIGAKYSGEKDRLPLIGFTQFSKDISKLDGGICLKESPDEWKMMRDRNIKKLTKGFVSEVDEALLVDETDRGGDAGGDEDIEFERVLRDSNWIGVVRRWHLSQSWCL